MAWKDVEAKMNKLEEYATSLKENGRYPTDKEVLAKMDELGIPQD
jgi:hypothetical protein